jgi:hypothetical protein
MKTSLTELIGIEKYLSGDLTPEQSLVFNARLLISQPLRKRTFLQKLVHRLVHLYHRRLLKREVEAVHARLFYDPAHADFRGRVMKIFNR